MENNRIGWNMWTHPFLNALATNNAYYYYCTAKAALWNQSVMARKGGAGRHSKKVPTTNTSRSAPPEPSKSQSREKREAEEEAGPFDKQSCPECHKPFNSTDLRPVQESCRHVKCRKCLITYQNGCLQCNQEDERERSKKRLRSNSTSRPGPSESSTHRSEAPIAATSYSSRHDSGTLRHSSAAGSSSSGRHLHNSYSHETSETYQPTVDFSAVQELTAPRFSGELDPLRSDFDQTDDIPLSRRVRFTPVTGKHSSLAHSTSRALISSLKYSKSGKRTQESEVSTEDTDNYKSSRSRRHDLVSGHHSHNSSPTELKPSGKRKSTQELESVSPKIHRVGSSRHDYESGRKEKTVTFVDEPYKAGSSAERKTASPNRFFHQSALERESKKNSAIANSKYPTNAKNCGKRSDKKSVIPVGTLSSSFPVTIATHLSHSQDKTSRDIVDYHNRHRDREKHSTPSTSSASDESEESTSPKLTSKALSPVLTKSTFTKTYGKSSSIAKRPTSEKSFSAEHQAAHKGKSGEEQSSKDPLISGVESAKASPNVTKPSTSHAQQSDESVESTSDNVAQIPASSSSSLGKKKKKRAPVVILNHITITKDGDRTLYRCDVCLKKFKTKAHIKYHEFCQNGEKPFKCEQCGQGFIAKSHYEYHLRTHTGERPYVCTECGKGFNQRGKVTRHMRSHTGEKPFVCQQCGRGFANAQAMRSHFLIHTGERPFACEFCNKRFTGMTNLKKHVITHTGERPFMCVHCGKSFGLKWTLDLHLRTHSSERPYACDQCSRAFSNSKDLRRHLVIHSGERPFKCWICGTAFRRKDNLDRHIKNTHNQPKEVAKKLANEAAAEYLASTKAAAGTSTSLPTNSIIPPDSGLGTFLRANSASTSMESRESTSSSSSQQKFVPRARGPQPISPPRRGITKKVKKFSPRSVIITAEVSPTPSPCPPQPVETQDTYILPNDQTDIPPGSLTNSDEVQVTEPKIEMPEITVNCVEINGFTELRTVPFSEYNNLDSIRILEKTKSGFRDSDSDRIVVLKDKGSHENDMFKKEETSPTSIRMLDLIIITEKQKLELDSHANNSSVSSNFSNEFENHMENSLSGQGDEPIQKVDNNSSDNDKVTEPKIREDSHAISNYDSNTSISSISSADDREEEQKEEESSPCLEPVACPVPSTHEDDSQIPPSSTHETMSNVIIPIEKQEYPILETVKSPATDPVANHEDTDQNHEEKEKCLNSAPSTPPIIIRTSIEEAEEMDEHEHSPSQQDSFANQDEQFDDISLFSIPKESLFGFYGPHEELADDAGKNISINTFPVAEDLHENDEIKESGPTEKTTPELLMTNNTSWISGTAFQTNDNLDRHVENTQTQPKEVAAEKLANEENDEYKSHIKAIAGTVTSPPNSIIPPELKPLDMENSGSTSRESRESTSSPTLYNNVHFTYADQNGEAIQVPQEAFDEDVAAGKPANEEKDEHIPSIKTMADTLTSLQNSIIPAQLGTFDMENSGSTSRESRESTSSPTVPQNFVPEPHGSESSSPPRNGIAGEISPIPSPSSQYPVEAQDTYILPIDQADIPPGSSTNSEEVQVTEPKIEMPELTVNRVEINGFTEPSTDPFSEYNNLDSIGILEKTKSGFRGSDTDHIEVLKDKGSHENDMFKKEETSPTSIRMLDLIIITEKQKLELDSHANNSSVSSNFSNEFENHMENSLSGQGDEPIQKVDNNSSDNDKVTEPKIREDTLAISNYDSNTSISSISSADDREEEQKEKESSPCLEPVACPVPSTHEDDSQIPPTSTQETMSNSKIPFEKQEYPIIKMTKSPATDPVVNHEIEERNPEEKEKCLNSAPSTPPIIRTSIDEAEEMDEHENSPLQQDSFANQDEQFDDISLFSIPKESLFGFYGPHEELADDAGKSISSNTFPVVDDLHENDGIKESGPTEKTTPELQMTNNTFWISGTAFQANDNLDRHVENTQTQPKEVAAEKLANEEKDEHTPSTTTVADTVTSLPNSIIPAQLGTFDMENSGSTSRESGESISSPTLYNNVHFTYADQNGEAIQAPQEAFDEDIRIPYASAAATADGDDDSGIPRKVRLLYTDALAYRSNESNQLQLNCTSATPNQEVNSDGSGHSVEIHTPAAVRLPSEGTLSPHEELAEEETGENISSNTFPVVEDLHENDRIKESGPTEKTTPELLMINNMSWISGSAFQTKDNVDHHVENTQPKAVAAEKLANEENDKYTPSTNAVAGTVTSSPNSIIPPELKPLDIENSGSASRESIESTASPTLYNNVHFTYADQNGEAIQAPQEAFDEDVRILYASAAATADGDDDSGIPRKVRLLYAEALAYRSNESNQLQFIYTSATPNQEVNSDGSGHSVEIHTPAVVRLPSEGTLSADNVQRMLFCQPPPPIATHSLPLPVRVMRNDGIAVAQTIVNEPENLSLIRRMNEIQNFIPSNQRHYHFDVHQSGGNYISHSNSNSKTMARFQGGEHSSYQSHHHQQHHQQPQQQQYSYEHMQQQQQSWGEEMNAYQGHYDAENEALRTLARAATARMEESDEATTRAAAAIAAVGQQAREQRQRELEQNRYRNSNPSPVSTSNNSTHHQGPRKHYLSQLSNSRE